MKIEERFQAQLQKDKEAARADGFTAGHKVGFAEGYKKGLKEGKEIGKQANKPSTSLMDRTAHPPDPKAPKIKVEVVSGAGRSTMGGW